MGIVSELGSLRKLGALGVLGNPTGLGNMGIVSELGSLRKLGALGVLGNPTGLGNMGIVSGTPPIWVVYKCSPP